MKNELATEKKTTSERCQKKTSTKWILSNAEMMGNERNGKVIQREGDDSATVF